MLVCNVTRKHNHHTWFHIPLFGHHVTGASVVDYVARCLINHRIAQRVISCVMFRGQGIHILISVERSWKVRWCHPPQDSDFAACVTNHYHCDAEDDHHNDDNIIKRITRMPAALT
jgi:hypothetical protein